MAGVGVEGSPWKRILMKGALRGRKKSTTGARMSEDRGEKPKDTRATKVLQSGQAAHRSQWLHHGPATAKQ